MIAFTTEEILLSIIYSIGFGVMFSCLYSASLGLISLLKSGSKIFAFFMVSASPFDGFKQKWGFRTYSPGPVHSFLSIILFAIGYSITSYVSLDGEIRLYTLIVSFASFYLSNSAFSIILNKIFLKFLSLILALFSCSVRLILSPLCMLINAAKKRKI